MRLPLGALAAAVLCAAAGASAEDARTLRIGVPDALHSVLYYHESSPATELLTHAAFDTLIAYDERRHAYAPLLARSWRRIDDRTLEIELREDVAWHDGVAVDADDVVYTLDWLGDAETKLYMQHKWDWIDHAEKLGRHKLRLVAKRPTPFDLARLATVIAILPEHKHGQLLAERPYFGKSPTGSGPYRAAVVDKETVLRRVESYRHGGEVKPPADIARVTVRGLAREALLPAFNAGDLDLVLDAPPDATTAIRQATRARLTTIAGYGMLVLAIDARARDRRADRFLADPRVRLALDTAIDRSRLVALAPGVRIPDHLCWSEQAGCGAAPPASVYDPMGARALLAAASASELEIEVAAQGRLAMLAAGIVARQWSAVGVSARVREISSNELYAKQRDGALQAAIVGWHAGEMPDVAETIAMFMAPGPWDLHGDAALHALAQASAVVMDDEARREIVRQAFARADDHAYFTVLGPHPSFALHGADVIVGSRGRYGALGVTLLDLRWR